MLETPVFAARRARAAASLGLVAGREFLLAGSGLPVPLPENTDQCYPFRAHAEYLYLAGLDTPGAVLAFDPAQGPEGGWASFVPELGEAERVWEGRSAQPGRPLAALPEWLGARAGRTAIVLGEPVPGVAADPAAAAPVRERLRHARRPKDGYELDLMRRAAAATAAGYAAARPFARPGVSERQLQIELEAAFFRAGGTATGYGTIVGTGPNAAVLHFAPTARAAREGEFVLVDAGAEVDRYVCDVTRTWVAGGAGGFHRDLWQLVRAVEEQAIARCRPGVEWRDVHLAAAAELAAGLADLGILRGRAESLVEEGAHLLFFPHGIGHMVGLGVRDAGGTAPGRQRSADPALRTLRCDLPLLPGYTMTVEPGLYFIPALLCDPERRARYKHAVAWDRVDGLLEVGGVRIEDNVLVTDGEPEILTAAIPKEL
jgi:Xaa-Pro aminopeptidase